MLHNRVVSNLDDSGGLVGLASRCGVETTWMLRKQLQVVTMQPVQRHEVSRAKRKQRRTVIAYVNHDRRLSWSDSNVIVVPHAATARSNALAMSLAAIAKSD